MKRQISANNKRLYVDIEYVMKCREQLCLICLSLSRYSVQEFWQRCLRNRECFSNYTVLMASTLWDLSAAYETQKALHIPKLSLFPENSRSHSAFTIGRTFPLYFPEANYNEKL